MNKDKFNKYCAKVMGLDYRVIKGRVFYDGCCDSTIEVTAYDDLNQMAEVVEKLAHPYKEILMVFTEGREIKDMFRGFIISTMPED